MENTRYPAMFALSADPWTKGHAWVLEAAKARYGERVLVGIANDPNKSYVFAQWERLRLAQTSLPDTPMENVRLVPGALARYLKREKVPVLVRGSRNLIDDAAETTLRFYYLKENPDLKIDTVRAEPDSPYAEISSSGVKGCLQVSHDISGFVSSVVKQALESRLLRQYPVCVTGEMGAGKSSFSKKIQAEAHKLGIPCSYVDFDAIAHEIYGSLTDPYYEDVRSEIGRVFGPSVGTEGGWIDRPALAKIVREDPGKLETLNGILSDPMLFRYRDVIAGKKGIVLIDGALLSEFGLTGLGNHHCALVTANVETRVDRVVARYAQNGRTMSRHDVETMVSLQKTAKEKAAMVRKKIELDRNGSIMAFDNGSEYPDARLALFEILRNVDVFGELRSALALRMLGMSEMDAEAVTAELKKQHEEAHRSYHTWEHVVELLDHLFECRASESLSDEDFAVLGAAILFHDSVYEIDPTYYRDNETRSASYARSLLGSKGVKTSLVKRVYAAVQSTSHASDRSEDSRDAVSDLLHDFDLAILASSPERYALYVTDIMTEFGIYPGETFRTKRVEFLEGLLARGDALYRTEYGRTKSLEAARKNISEEIFRLRAAD